MTNRRGRRPADDEEEAVAKTFTQLLHFIIYCESTGCLATTTTTTATTTSKHDHRVASIFGPKSVSQVSGSEPAPVQFSSVREPARSKDTPFIPGVTSPIDRPPWTVPN